VDSESNRETPPSGATAPTEGVDLSLIDAMLRMTPEQRLEQHERMLQTIQGLREGWARTRGSRDGQ
jgi:hypothetical protein